jgi:TolA-binding protein
MPKSKSRKNHKQKVNARRDQMKNEQNRIEKMKKDFIMNLINEEKKKGAFDNTKSVDDLNYQLPGDVQIDSSLEGPQI